MEMVIKAYNVGKADCFFIDLHDFDRIIWTHIDSDHIAGILRLIEDDSFTKNLSRKDNFFVVFNEYVDPSTISYKQGVRLKQCIGKYPNIKLINAYSQNYEMKIKDRCVIFKRVENNITCINEGSNSIIIEFISPTKEVLRKFMKNWKSNKKDAVITNDSSIVFLLSYQNKNILMTGDSSVRVFQKNLSNLPELKKIDVIKLPHHGSKNGNNDGILRLIDKYKCEKTIVSTKEDDKELDKKLIEEIENKIGKYNVIYSYNQDQDILII